MQITTMGLVLRATKTGENDRILAILTPEYGVVSAVAKGSQRLKNKLFSATGLFCYSEFVLFPGKNLYTVDDAQEREIFFGLHEDVEAMGLGMYCAELALTLSPTGEEAGALLRLLLNTFFYLSRRKRGARQLKAVFEMRTLTLTGFMPDLVACADCMCYEGGAFCFDPDSAQIFCAKCAQKRGLACNLSPAALAALRHIVYAEDAVLFNFTLPDEALRQLSAATEPYVTNCLDKEFKTLPFLHSVLT